MSKKDVSDRKEAILNFDTTNNRVKESTPQAKISEYKAIVYCRVSDKQQVTEGHGLEWQERVCIERCQKQTPSIHVEAVFKEPGVSWAKTNRKQFNNALNFLKDQNKKYTKITHFVVSEASRISRPENIIEAFTLEEQIKSLGVEIIKVDAPWIDDNTDEWLLFKTIQYAIAWYERKKIAKRANNGRRNRMMNGFWPFSRPPVGYLRRRISKKEYIDEIDPVKWPLIKKGLELFATNVLVSKVQMRDYRNKNGLLTYENGAKKLRRTFPEQVLQLHRLFYYAGYILYPEWDISEPIEGKHEGIISLGTVFSIIEKVKSNHKTNTGKIKAIKMNEEHPLRGYITCPQCKRKFTSRNTSKYIGKWPDKAKKLYPYYGCNNIYCKWRVYIKKEVLEKDFEELLSSLKLPKSIHMLIDVIFQKNREQISKNNKLVFESRQKQIQQMKQKQKQLEDAILATKNVKLQSKYEMEREDLDSEIEVMEEEYSNSEITQATFKAMLQKTKTLFEDPLALRKIGNSPLRQLLISVRFWDDLYYSKDKWLRTTGTGSLYSIFQRSLSTWSTQLATYQKRKTVSKEFIDNFKGFMITQQRQIEAIWANLEFLDLLKEDKFGNVKIQYHSN